MGADGSKPEQLTHDALDVEPVFSPDGARIAFGRITGDSQEGQLEAIYVINSDGTGLREVVAPRAGLEHPDWSPDGKSIVSDAISFNIAPENATAADSGSILSVQADRSHLRVIQPRTSDLKFFKAVWSPDGREILSGCFDTQARIDRICTVSPEDESKPLLTAPRASTSPHGAPKTNRGAGAGDQMSELSY
jgi:dipeptidyl aminopeptidase/acylaminoacyl peptidase